MSTRLGISISSDRVHVVLLTRTGVVKYHVESLFDPDDQATLRIAMRRALAGLPWRPWRRRTVVALGAHASQVRMLSELPPLGDARSLARIVEESSGRFFVRNGAPLITGGIGIVDVDRAWAAGYAKPVIEALRDSSRDLRVRLVGVVPSATVVQAGLEGNSLTWTDGQVGTRIELEDGRRREVSRFRASDSDSSNAVHMRPVLSVLGDDGWRYAAAYGAALLGDREPVRLDRRHLVAESSKDRSRRVLVAWAVLAMALLFAALSPGIAALVTERRAGAQLREMATEHAAVTQVLRDLEAVDSALSEGAALAANNRSVVSFLASVTTELPDDVALSALQIDSAGGHIMILARRAATALATMDSVRGIASAEIVGPVTKEMMAERELERAVIRFRWLPNACALARPGCERRAGQQ